MRHMKALFVLVSIALLASGVAVAQGTAGTLSFCNASAPTRLGSAGGPLAGSAHFAQLLVGSAPDSLAPATGQFLTTRLPISPLSHLPESGLIGNFDVLLCPWVVLDNFEAGETVYVQIAAWNAAVWGETFAAVPATQVGRTDVVPVLLSLYTQPAPRPKFTKPAIIPAVPEPSAFLLESLAIALLGGLLRVRGSRG